MNLPASQVLLQGIKDVEMAKTPCSDYRGSASSVKTTHTTAAASSLLALAHTIAFAFPAFSYFRSRQRVEALPLFILGANGLQIRLKIDFRIHTRPCSRFVSLWYAIALNDLSFYIALSFSII